MNLFYELPPVSIMIGDTEIPIVTDFREYVKLLDMLKDDSLNAMEKRYLLAQYFKEPPVDFESAMMALTDFVTMKTDSNTELEEVQQVESKRELYSFEYDYPFIFSAFFSEYGINIQTIPYLHWWNFRMLFEGLSDKTEIKQRIMYRGIDLNTIKNKDERERIQKIQNAIRIPQSRVSDYDIGDAFEW